MEPTRDLFNWNLTLKLMALLRHSLFNLAITVIVQTILMQVSAEQLLSVHRVAPRYLKLVSSSNFCLFMLIFVLMSFALLIMIFLFSVLTSISYVLALS